MVWNGTIRSPQYTHTRPILSARGLGMVGGVAAVSAANVGTAAAIRAHAVISCLTAVCQRERRVKKKAVIAAKSRKYPV